MTDILSGNHYGEQLTLDVDTTEQPVAPPEIADNVTQSPAYRELRELRDKAYERRRSGARAIARGAFAALQAGELSHEEYQLLFEDREQTAPGPVFDDLAAQHPRRELDWAERAAGEGVRHAGEDDE